ncbi:MAG: hypothetical protein J2P23_07775 [Microlunatus sp.]|nr:hypothetical protein [Microlunatus sp.]
MAEKLSATIAGLRSWARGAYAEEAAVELLARAFGGRFASASWPWIRPCDGTGWYWLDPDAIWTGSGALSGGERRLLNVVAALVGGQPIADLGGTLAGLDRRNQQLVLAAFAHAGGSHEHTVMIMAADGLPLWEQPGALVEWPAPVEAVS